MYYSVIKPTVVLIIALLLHAPLCVAGNVIYVNNLIGGDHLDGRAMEPAEGAGPYRTIQKALNSLMAGDSIEITNTGVPYLGGNILMREAGTEEKPLVINGNGATISGLQVIPPKKWRVVEPGIFAHPFWPMSNYLKIDKKVMRWIGSPKIWRLNGAAAPNCASLEELRATPTGFFWNKETKEVWFHLPEEKNWDDLEVAIPVLGTGLNIHSPADHVVIKNLRSEFSSNDGFSAHFRVKNLRFENCIAVDNCGQGFSMHDTVHAVVRDCFSARNASSGACDVHESKVLYERCIFVNNSFEAGVFAKDKAQTRYAQCLIINNHPFEQAWQIGESQMAFVKCLIVGSNESPSSLMKLDSGRVSITDSALFGVGKVATISGSGELTVSNSLLSAEPATATERIQLTNITISSPLSQLAKAKDLAHVLQAAAEAGASQLPFSQQDTLIRDKRLLEDPKMTLIPK